MQALSPCRLKRHMCDAPLTYQNPKASQSVDTPGKTQKYQRSPIISFGSIQPKEIQWHGAVQISTTFATSIQAT
jgi:hypothetical protein